jgi:hypothetical protein
LSLKVKVLSGTNVAALVADIGHIA